MKLEHTRRWLELGRIADEWSNESKLSRNEVLERLLGAIWQGEFEDAAGRTSVHVKVPPSGEALFNRRKLLSALKGFSGDTIEDHKGPLIDIPPRAFIPDNPAKKATPWAKVRDKVPWRELAALQLDDYSEFFVEINLERLRVARGAFLRWCRRRSLDLPAFWFACEHSKAATERVVGVQAETIPEVDADDPTSHLRPDAREQWEKLKPESASKIVDWWRKTRGFAPQYKELNKSQRKEAIAGRIATEYEENGSPAKGAAQATIRSRLDQFFVSWDEALN